MTMDKGGATIAPATGGALDGSSTMSGPTASVWTVDADLEGQKKRHLMKVIYHHRKLSAYFHTIHKFPQSFGAVQCA